MDKNILIKFYENSPNAYSCVQVIFDKQGTPIDYIYITMNKAYEELMGLKQDDVCGKKFYEIFPNGWEGESEWIEKQKEAIQNRCLANFDIFRAEKQRWIRVLSFPIEEDIFGFIHHDVTKEYLMDKEIEGFLKVNIDMLSVSKSDGTLIKANRAFERILGYAAEEIEGENLLSLIHEEDIPMTKAAMAKFEEEKSLSSFVNRVRCKNGQYKYLEWHSRPTGKYIYSSARDVTEKLEMEVKLKEKNERLQRLTERLKLLADRDELTGLYNRHYLYEKISKEIKRADKGHYPISIIIFDLDHFKKVNDTWGHPVGDEVLKEVAQLPAPLLSDSDFLVRLGGEEFMAVLVGRNVIEAVEVAEEIRKVIESYDFPIVGHLTASFGVAEKGELEHFYNWYKRADEALYCAKKSGRNRVTVIHYNEKYPCPHPSIEWRKDLESGVKIIDDQHKELFEMANRLINVSIAGMGMQTALLVIDQVIQNIEIHFRTEEGILAQTNFPDLEEHKEMHRRLLEKAYQLKQMFIEGKTKLSTIYTFIIDEIITEHTKESDAKFFAHLKNAK